MNDEDETSKVDDESFQIDTSDVTSSDGGYNKLSPNESSLLDPYYKIKSHAVLCLDYLFKNKSKALFNFWYILFPSFFMR